MKTPSFRFAVLAYHSQNVGGQTYASNDHLALESDLRQIASRNIPIVPLHQIVGCLREQGECRGDLSGIAISCDDGSILDWEDYDHPDQGFQRSFANILRNHLDRQCLDTKAMLTAFVIGSPEARVQIDEVCYGGLPLSNSAWWVEAAREGMVAIENHSWDHVHSAVQILAHPSCQHDDFYSVDTYTSAALEIEQASRAIEKELADMSHQCSLFAYPYGHHNAYLRDAYLPNYIAEHQISGAFTTEPSYVDHRTNVYAIPRFVCGSAWNSPHQFGEILDGLS